MKKFEEIWKKANEEADSKYEPRGTLAWGVFLKEALEKRIEPLFEKQQPEIPEFVAEWIKSQDHNTRNRNGTLVYEHYKKEPENDDYYPVHDWTADHFDEFLQALIYGYTVKEKRFYLKHKSVLIFDPDSDDSDVEELYLGAGGNFVPYQHLAKIFTQSEIDSMETGSYEQVEVEE